MTEPITPEYLRTVAGSMEWRGENGVALEYRQAAAEIERLQRELRVSGRALELVDGWVGDEYTTLVRNAEQQARAEIEKEDADAD